MRVWRQRRHVLGVLPSRREDNALHCLACGRTIGSHAEQPQNTEAVAEAATDAKEPQPASKGAKPYRPIFFVILALACFALDVAALTQPLYEWNSYDFSRNRPLQLQTSCWKTCVTDSNGELTDECRGYPYDEPCVKHRFNALRAFGVLSCIFAFLGGAVIAPVMDCSGKLTGRAGKLMLVAIASVLFVFQTVYWAIDLSMFFKGCGDFGAVTDYLGSERQISSTLFMASTGVAILMIGVALLSGPADADTNNEVNDDGNTSKQ